MDFNIPEELKSVQELAARILSDFTAVEQLRQLEQQAEPFDETLWGALAEAGKDFVADGAGLLGQAIGAALRVDEVDPGAGPRCRAL